MNSKKIVVCIGWPDETSPFEKRIWSTFDGEDVSDLVQPITEFLVGTSLEMEERREEEDEINADPAILRA